MTSRRSIAPRSRRGGCYDPPVIAFTPGPALAGGALLGLAATMLYALNGRIAGVSGVVGGLPAAAPGDRAWRLLFLAGLLTGGLALEMFDGAALARTSEQALPVAIVAGVLVGVGTRLARGCTSGHGLCGVSRLSTRSLAATLVFMAAGMATVFVVRHLLHPGAAS